MQLRKTLGAAALITATMMASMASGCGDDRNGGNPVPDSGPGCVGTCSDAGTDAGTRVCPAPTNGRGPIGVLRDSATRGQAVTLDEVVVTAVSQATRGDAGDYIARFWVVDTCFPKEGIFVDKFFTDETKNYEPKVGDVLSIQGLYRKFNATASDNAPSERDAYRPVIKSDFRLGGGITGKLVIIKKGTTTPPADNVVPAGFGDAKGGTETPNPEFAGSRVYIPGPLTLTNAQPTAMKQRPEDPDSGTYLGFEVTGGVLVSNYKTFNVPGCDWRAVAADGGTVTFQDGIRGVWDTYSNVPCVATDAGTRDGGGTFITCTQSGDGGIPGTTNPYTHVLYPMDCTTDLVGDAGTP